MSLAVLQTEGYTERTVFDIGHIEDVLISRMPVGMHHGVSALFNDELSGDASTGMEHGDSDSALASVP